MNLMNTEMTHGLMLKEVLITLLAINTDIIMQYAVKYLTLKIEKNFKD